MRGETTVGRNRFVAIKEQQFFESFLPDPPFEFCKVEGDGGKTFQLLFNPPGSFSLFPALSFFLVRSDKKIFTFLFPEIFPATIRPSWTFWLDFGMQGQIFLFSISTLGPCADWPRAMLPGVVFRIFLFSKSIDMRKSARLVLLHYRKKRKKKKWTKKKNGIGTIRLPPKFWLRIRNPGGALREGVCDCSSKSFVWKQAYQ